MGKDEFIDYLNTLYGFYNNNRVIKDEDGVAVYLLRTIEGEPKGWPIYIILQNYSGDKEIIFSNKVFGDKFCFSLCSKLKEIFKMDRNSEGFVRILPNNGKVTNKFSIEVLDTIIKNMDPETEDIVIKKK